jgi:hypothetical protein
MPPPPELATPVVDSLRAWSRASEALLRREARPHAATPVQPSTIPSSPCPVPFGTPVHPLHTTAHPVHPSPHLCTPRTPTLHPPCTHPAPHPAPCTSACCPLQEWLLELVQGEAECRAKPPLLSRARGADEAAIRGAKERETQRAKFEMANKAVRHAIKGLEKQNFTLTLRGEAYAEKMLCDEAPLERCPGSGPDPNREPAPEVETRRRARAFTNTSRPHLHHRPRPHSRSRPQFRSHPRPHSRPHLRLLRPHLRFLRPTFAPTLVSYDEAELVSALVVQNRTRTQAEFDMADLFAPRGTAALATTNAAPLAWTTPPNTASAWQSHMAAHATAAAATAAAATATAAAAAATAAAAAAAATAAAAAAATAAAAAAAAASQTPRPPSAGFWGQRATTPATPAVLQQATPAEPARPSSARLALPSRTTEARASAAPRPATSVHTARKPASPMASAPRSAPTREVWVARRAAELAISRGAALLATDVLASPRRARPPSRSTPKPPGMGQ